jgi:hypothetical protein
MESVRSIQKRYQIILLLAAVFLCFHSSVAKGEETGKIAVNYTASSVTFRVYKAASKTEAGYEKEESFKDCVMDFEKQDGESLRDLGLTLYACVIKDQILPDMEEVTDQEGDTLFSGLEEGWYLLTSDNATVPVMVEVTGEKAVQVTPKAELPNQGNPSENQTEPSTETETETEVSTETETHAPTETETQAQTETETQAPTKTETEVSTETETQAPTETEAQAQTETVRVKKVWSDKGHEKERPSSLVVFLYQDDTLYDTVRLRERSNWTYTWSELPADHVYLVVEKSVPKGYEMTISREGSLFQIKNVRQPAVKNDTPVVVETKSTEKETSVTVKKESLPRTGQMWWPVILLAAGGILFVVWGLIMKKNRK